VNYRFQCKTNEGGWLGVGQASGSGDTPVLDAITVLTQRTEGGLADGEYRYLPDSVEHERRWATLTISGDTIEVHPAD
jgi:ABC-type dipeptide/oligopeptide/nickel transport system ATPase subunit